MVFSCYSQLEDREEFEVQRTDLVTEIKKLLNKQAGHGDVVVQ
jgi:hypothetical protein